MEQYGVSMDIDPYQEHCPLEYHQQEHQPQEHHQQGHHHQEHHHCEHPQQEHRQQDHCLKEHHEQEHQHEHYQEEHYQTIPHREHYQQEHHQVMTHKDHHQHAHQEQEDHQHEHHQQINKEQEHHQQEQNQQEHHRQEHQQEQEHHQEERRQTIPHQEQYQHEHHHQKHHQLEHHEQEHHQQEHYQQEHHQHEHRQQERHHQEQHEVSPERGEQGQQAYTKTVCVDSSQTCPGPQPSVDTLQREVEYLRKELCAARDHIRTLQERGKGLRDRLEEQTHHQFQVGNEQFEDVSLGFKRPTELIRRYGDLYLDGRVDALDALDQLPPLQNQTVLKQKIVFSVIVLAFKATQTKVAEVRAGLRHLLGLPAPSPLLLHLHHSPSTADDNDHSSVPVPQQHRPCTVTESKMEHQITTYLCHTADTLEVADMVFEVCQQIYSTLFDYPCLKACPALLEFITQCVRIMWGLCVQRWPYVLVYDDNTFDDGVHTRFHTSDPDQGDIQTYLWPALLDAQGVCVSKAVVIT